MAGSAGRRHAAPRHRRVDRLRRAPRASTSACSCVVARFAEQEQARVTTPGRDHRRTGAHQHGAAAGPRRERRPARPTPGPGPRGGRRRRAPPARRRDPRHPRPGPDRHHRPAPGGRRAPPTPTAARAHLERAATLARHSLGEARRSVHNLAPVALEHDGLPEALRKTVAEWGERTGVRAEFTLTGTAEHAPRRGRRDPAAHRPGGPVERGPARPRRPRRRHPVLHGRRGDPRHPRRRQRLRPAAAAPAAPAAAASASTACGPAPNASRGAARRGVRTGPGHGACRLAYRWSAMTATRREPGDHPADRRRPPRRTGRPARHVRVGAPASRSLGEAADGVEAVERPRDARPGRGPDGPADAGRRRGGRDPRAGPPRAPGPRSSS